MKWNRFWFEPRDLYNVAVFRAVLGVVLFIMYSIRIADIEDFFFDAGLLPLSQTLSILPELYHSPMPVYFQSDSSIYMAHIVFLVGLALLTLGIIGRSLTWVVWVLHLGFMQRNYSLVYGADLFANFWLFYLSFIRHNDNLNVLNLISARRKKRLADSVAGTRLSNDLLSLSFTRLIQIQLCICYAYTGIEKLKGLQWWEGTAFWYTLGMQELVVWDLTFLRQIPVAIGLLSMAPLLFEIYFPMGVMQKKIRPAWLLIGLIFHFGTALIMDLWFFCFVMVSCYLVFIDSQTLRERLTRWVSSLGSLTPRLKRRVSA